MSKTPKTTEKKLKEEKMGRESPVITLPYDETLIARLRLKLEEYKKRYDIYHAPESQMDTIMKTEVLERILEARKIKTFDLARELEEKFGSSYSARHFNRACSVIQDYITTGGDPKKHGGTGLPNVH